MKIISNDIALESQQDINAFNELVSFFKRLEDEKLAKAQRVFDAYCDNRFPEDIDPENPAHDQAASVEIDRWTDAVDASISEFLDHRTIGAFIEIVIANESKARQVRAAHKRHQENRSMKAEVFQWLDTNMSKFESLDKAAAAVTKQQPIGFRTARRWVGDWKKLPPAGTL